MRVTFVSTFQKNSLRECEFKTVNGFNLTPSRDKYCSYIVSATRINNSMAFNLIYLC